MSITPLPTPPSRSSPADFADKADTFLAALPTFATEVNAIASDIDDAAAAAAISEANASSSESVALAAANYEGEWGDQTGAANVPYSVSHQGKFYALASNLVDVTAKEPGVDSEWVLIGPESFTRSNYTQASSPVSLTAAQCNGFHTLTNTGATGEVEYDLPAGADGLRVRLMVTAAQYATAKANGTETIRYLGDQSKAGGKIRGNVIGYVCDLEWSGTQWVAITQGLWELETS